MPMFRPSAVAAEKHLASSRRLDSFATRSSIFCPRVSSRAYPKMSQKAELAFNTVPSWSQKTIPSLELSKRASSDSRSKAMASSISLCSVMSLPMDWISTRFPSRSKIPRLVHSCQRISPFAMKILSSPIMTGFSGVRDNSFSRSEGISPGKIVSRKLFPTTSSELIPRYSQ